MSNRVRNFRRRSDDDNNNDDDDTKPQTTKKPQSTTTPKPKKPSLLSFADEESADVITPISRNRPSISDKKPNSSRLSLSSSSHSHKLTSAKERNTPKERFSSNVQPQAGVYTKEALLELQKNMKTLGGSSNRGATHSEPVIVLKGIIKPIVNNSVNDSNRNRNSIENIVNEVKELDSDNDDEDVFDQAKIDAIKAKRERLRKSKPAAPDFISLDLGSNHGEAEGLSDEEPEFVGRIAMIGEKNEVKKGVFDFDDGRKESGVDGKGKGNDGVGEYDDDDDEEEEDKMWEEEQVRKGLGKRMDEGVSVRGVSSSSSCQNVQQRGVYQAANVSSYVAVNGGPSIGGSVGWSSGSDTLSIAQQAEVSMKALRESVTRLKETHGRTLTSLTKTDENLSDSLTKVTALENALTAAGDKFVFMQKLRDYVSVICDFLQDKAPFIEELEYQMQKLHKERAESIIERREADSNDELTEIEASVNAAMAVFNRGGTSSSVIEAASIAAQAALTASQESRNLPVKLDEFGRDMNQKDRMDIKRRAESRQRRKTQSDSKRISSMETDNFVEGESSTDESDTESSAYESNRDQLLQIAGEIFSDADEEFSQLSTVKERFEMWKKDYSSSYRDAYMSLSIPAIFSPYVRLELLKWDPLHHDSDFIDMQWHELLFSYGLPEDESEVNPDDADVNLVPDLVEKVAVPILQHEITHCWDMLSTKETKFAVSATNLVFRYVPLSSKVVGELVNVLRARLSDAVANLMVPTWNTLILKAVPNAARYSAYKFGMSVRLMRNICLWNDILSKSLLEKLVLDELLSGKVLPHLRSVQSNIHDAITRTERVVASLSGVWTGPNVTGDRSLKLQPMVDYLLVLSRTLEKRESSSGTNGLARRLKKMLVELNEYDHARTILRTFNLKEAL